MKVALVLLHPKDIDPLFAFLADSGLASASLSGWNVEGDFSFPNNSYPHWNTLFTLLRQT
jgi:hypothetical protein